MAEPEDCEKLGVISGSIGYLPHIIIVYYRILMIT